MLCLKVLGHYIFLCHSIYIQSSIRCCETLSRRNIESLKCKIESKKNECVFIFVHHTFLFTNRLRFSFSVEKHLKNLTTIFIHAEIYFYQMVICGAFYPFYFVSGEVDDAESIKVLSGHDPFSTVMVCL